MTNLENITKQVCSISRDVGNYLTEEIKKLKSADIIVKGTHDYVSYVDKTAEEMITKELQKIIPEAGFIVEENTIDKKGKEYTWIVDPLDGTTNYIHSVPLYSISIALMKDDEIVSGVIHEPNLNECFFAWKDSKAYLNQHEIRVSKTNTLEDSLFATGFPYYDYSKLNQYMELFKWFMVHSRGVRRLGSAAVDLAYVACGRYDGFYEYGLRPWDVAAGSLIVKQAGGSVSDFKGGDDYIFGKEIITTNAHLFPEFRDLMKRMFL